MCWEFSAALSFLPVNQLSWLLLQLVFDYFCARTPRSFVEKRETSLVWNYKYAGVFRISKNCFEPKFTATAYVDSCERLPCVAVHHIS